jgi:hypothetical protein
MIENERDLIKDEIELLKDSKEIDKFEYGVFVSVYLASVALLISLIAIYVTSDDSFRLFFGIIFGGIFFIIITLSFYFTRFKPTLTSFKNKHSFMKERYEKLGVKIIALENELKKLK